MRSARARLLLAACLVLAVGSCAPNLSPPPLSDALDSDADPLDSDPTADVAEPVDTARLDTAPGPDSLSCDCDDENPCTTDSCTQGDCSHVARAGERCNDSDGCTEDDACDARGFCAGRPRSCPDGSDGMFSVCHPARGCIGVSPSDDIYGTTVARATSWWTLDGDIFHGARHVALRGLNWFGLETSEFALHGLWTGRTIDEFLSQIRGVGFNALRIPIVPETLDPSTRAADWAVAQGYATGLDGLLALLEATGDIDLPVLLDLHNCSTAVGIQAGFPADCPDFDMADWHAVLEQMAVLALDYPHVLGIEIFNEPYKLKWTTWAAQAAVAGENILRKNPYVLIFVQGVAGESNIGPAAPAWGENLVSAGTLPVELPAARRIYAPHVYGPSVFSPTWVGGGAVFEDVDFPESVVPVWEAHFGYLVDLGECVAPTEFGDHYDDAIADGGVAWMDRLVRWMVERPVRNWFYWALNPNSVDTGGVLLDDWMTTDSRKLRAMAPILWRSE